MEKIRVLLADDHPLVRVGIRTTLEETGDIQVIGEVACGSDLLPRCLELNPAVLILDLNMPNLEPAAEISVLKCRLPHLKIVILSAFNALSYVHSMTEAEVDGYVLKDNAPEDLAEAIRAVTRGEIWYSQAVVQQILALRRMESQSATLQLSAREKEVLELIACGWNNAQIAAELHLAQQTIRNYISKIYQVLNVSSRAEAVVWAIENLKKETISNSIRPTNCFR